MQPWSCSTIHFIPSITPINYYTNNTCPSITIYDTNTPLDPSLPTVQRSNNSNEALRLELEAFKSSRYVSMCVYICISVYLYVYMSICMYACLSILLLCTEPKPIYLLSSF